MTNLLTQAQCFTLAKRVGFDDKNAEIAAAIAVTETLTYSNGTQYADFDKVGDVSLQDDRWGPSIGGWQIRSLKAELGKGTARDEYWLGVPLNNATAARKIFLDAGGKWTPWSTFTSGAYLGAMQQAVYNPKPNIPAGSYMVAGGDTLGAIALKTKSKGMLGAPWTYLLIAAINRIRSPYTIFPGQVILLPDWPYTVASGDTLNKIAVTYAEVTVDRIAKYNKLVNPNNISVGQKLFIPRYTSWTESTRTLVL